MTKTITVKGVGSASVRPDYITLSLSLSAKDKDYEKAMADAARRIELLEAAAQSAGFEKGALKATNFNVHTEYENIRDVKGNFQRAFVGYVCFYQFKLAFDFDAKRLSETLPAIFASGANPELDIAFTVKDPAKVNEALLSSATANALEKAELLCRASGAKLGELLSIDYAWGKQNLVSPTRYEMEDCVQPLMASSKCRMPELEPDDITVSDTVTFVWEIA